MDWNKDHIRETMLLLETAALHSARENYLDYVSTARLDRSEPIENDELAQDDRFRPQVGRQRRRCRQAVRPPLCDRGVNEQVYLSGA